MKTLLDTGTFIHSEFAEDAIQRRTVNWGGVTQTVSVHGFIRKKPGEDTKNQTQKDALFTVGRLIRKGRIQAYCYHRVRQPFAANSGELELTQKKNGVDNCVLMRVSVVIMNRMQVQSWQEKSSRQ